jgi:phytanoyl-CoA dioxygenase PhyH
MCVRQRFGARVMLKAGTLRRTKSAVRNLTDFGLGYWHYLRTGVTPHGAYASMRALYCVSNGRFTNAAARLASLAHPPRRHCEPDGVLGRVDSESLREVVTQLRERGVHVFRARLDPAVCERLTAFSLAMPAIPTPGLPEPGMRYERGRPSAVLYQIDEAAIGNHADVQLLISDPTLLAVAQAYLGVEPVLDLLDLWWSTAYCEKPSSEAAQLFHFDLDRLKFIKFFCYLTPVSQLNGPHSFVEGSHRIKPKGLRRDGRVSDAEILSHYAAEKVVHITGPQGTIFVVDTRGFHKGVRVLEGDRLALQIQFSTDLFGAPYQRHVVTRPLEKLRRAKRDHPRVYCRFSLAAREDFSIADRTAT